MGFSGCASVINERRNAAMRERSDIDNLKAKLSRLEEQVDGITAAQQDLYRERETLHSSQEKNRLEFENRLSEMERALKAAEAARARLRQEIIESLSKKMAEIIRLQAVQAPRFEEGREHTVQPGETLSEIAAVYKVEVSAIVKANKLKSADSIRAGQKLFIPE